MTTPYKFVLPVDAGLLSVLNEDAFSEEDLVLCSDTSLYELLSVTRGHYYKYSLKAKAYKDVFFEGSFQAEGDHVYVGDPCYLFREGFDLIQLEADVKKFPEMGKVASTGGDGFFDCEFTLEEIDEP